MFHVSPIVRHRLGFKYYSSVAKYINTWRDMPRDIYCTWCDTFGCESAAEYVLRMPSKCIAGRWGSIANSEADIGNSAVLGASLRLLFVFVHIVSMWLKCVAL